jgi:uncharacterized membrane protein YoaK (UPF0700 family)
MTLVSGLVDAFSFLVLGHVFVANMTGNVIFLGFALAGERGFSITASLLALTAFWIGATINGRVNRSVTHRGRRLVRGLLAEVVLATLGLILFSLSHHPLGAGAADSLVVLLAAAMGVQNATAAALGVRGLTTTVVTRTITEAASHSVLAGGAGATSGRSVVAVATLFIGALCGVALILHVRQFTALTAALVILVAVMIAAHLTGRATPAWTSEP